VNRASCLHAEVPCSACLREAATAKAGHAGVILKPANKIHYHYTPNLFTSFLLEFVKKEHNKIRIF
jgi:hypothetical protein